MSPKDREAIEAAVREAEARTRGEIYCVVAQAASDYREVVLAWAAGVALLAPALLLAGGVQISAPDLTGGWTAAQVGDVASRAARAALTGAILLQAALFLVTALVVALPPVRRALTPKALKRHRVREKAQEQFLSRNLRATRERTGVLIFVAVDERMAEIVADEGIASAVGPEVWTRAMAALVEGLKRGEPAAGFAAAVGLCGDVLAEHFPLRADNPDELPDSLVELPRG
ncbi:TPM domain-containing protein [Phenylobacterium sp.]|uniref:TPM domain-containing protein n=1 Tax=Phenylobacterium sp. TaxID=1871053 RepID=UPI002F3FFD07